MLLDKLVKGSTISIILPWMWQKGRRNCARAWAIGVRARVLRRKREVYGALRFALTCVECGGVNEPKEEGENREDIRPGGEPAIRGVH